MKLLQTLGLSLCIAGTLVTPSWASNDEQQIISLEQQWLDASIRGDKAFVQTLLDAAYVNVNLRGQIRSKSDVLAAPPVPAQASQHLSNLEVRLHGDTAVVTGVNTYRANAAASPLQVTFSDVYIRRDGTWRLISAQETLRNPLPQ
ncbi:MAG: nuclear transport factor 2 family protein [Pseudomonas sp.]